MKKTATVLAALAAALMMMGGTAEAAKKKKAKVVVTPAAPVYWWTGPWTVRDPRLATSNLVVGGGATGAYFALKDGTSALNSSGAAWVAASAACAAVSPIVGTLVVNRPLTQREVFVSTANCVVPIIGGLAMNYWFDYYGWDRPKAKGRRG